MLTKNIDRISKSFADGLRNSTDGISGPHFRCEVTIQHDVVTVQIAPEIRQYKAKNVSLHV